VPESNRYFIVTGENPILDQLYSLEYVRQQDLHH